jgi:osmotically-inducible protein OsmY
MSLKTTSLSIIAAAMLLTGIASCGPKDAEVKMAVETILKDNPGVMVDVKDGVATLSGKFTDDATKAAAENAIKAVSGVKSVVDNATVTPPAPPSADESLKSSVSAALQPYSGLNASVQDGVLMLSGTLKKQDLPKVMQLLSALHPKKIVNKATIIK